MNITTVSSNRYNNSYSSNKTRSHLLSFRGALNENLEKHALEMLKSKLSSVKIGSDYSDIRPVIDQLIQKWNGISITKNSVGIMDIPDEHLANFLGEKGRNIITRDKKGICVAIGDKYAPVHTWEKCYDAVALLIPKKESGF